MAVGWVFSVQMITPLFSGGLLGLEYRRDVCSTGKFFGFCSGYIRLRSHGLRYVLILGTNPRAADFARRVLASRERGYRLLGFVDDEWPGITEFNKTGFQVVSDYAGTARISYGGT